MKAYSNDLRERVTAACAEPGATQTAVAVRFCVLVSFVEKAAPAPAGKRVGGQAAPPQRPGPPLFDAAARAGLGDCLGQQPEATLDELRVWLAALGGPAVSPSTLCRAVQALDWRRKKERPRRRARHRLREGVASGLGGGGAN